MVEGREQALQDVRARLGLAELEEAPSGHHLAAMVDEVLDHLLERQHRGLPSDDRQVDDAEGGLQLSEPVEVVEDDLGDGVALALDDNTHPVAV